MSLLKILSDTETDEILFDCSEDKFREECGLMGVWGHPEAANLTYLGLYAQQHRGQEGVGIVSVDRRDGAPNGGFTVHKGTALVADVFRDFDFSKLPGAHAIGHVRYTTAGGNKLANVQPLYAQVASGRVAVAHNGNLINAVQLRQSLIRDGAIFGSSSDTEAILHLIARAPKSVSLEESVIQALEQVRGAYSLLIAFHDRIIAVRDPAGLRPLCVGRLDGAYVFASETCALDLIGAEYLRDIEPGELFIVKNNSKNDLEEVSYFPFKRVPASPCVFEYIYFARPDSSVFNKNVYPVRKKMGAELARENPVKADMVVPVPDSGTTAAIGYSQEAGIPLELGLIRNHYVGRTFIEPKQSIRDFGVKIKLNANGNVFAGKSIVVVDDSIVRGTTCKKLIAMFRRAGAKEVHLRISAPPTSDPCYYGIDTPDKEELIASHKSVEEIREYLDVDTLSYLSVAGLYRAVGVEQGTMCDACFSGNYPLGTPKAPKGPSQEALFGASE